MSAKLIEDLTANLSPVRPLRPVQFWLMTGATLGVALAVIVMRIGLRSDFAGTVQSLPLVWKMLAPLALTGVLSLLVLQASRPGARITMGHWIALAGVVTLFWLPGLIGLVRYHGAAVFDVDPRACLTYVSMAAIVPLIGYLSWLRYAAPVHPMRAGALAGFAAGAAGAFAFATHCPHLEYQYISTFYSLPAFALAGIGAVAAKLLCKW